jgi:hypothetical protein
VTFTVNPGDDVFVQATLDIFADSRSQLFAFADAAHTLRMTFMQGDTSLLIAAGPSSAAAAPEPASGFLAVVGRSGAGPRGPPPLSVTNSRALPSARTRTARHAGSRVRLGHCRIGSRLPFRIRPNFPDG